ncbi:MAG: tetratricopeptide repeat protein [Bacteroidia bacterium]|nr:tetratricopeptide repeat protein [Bacteroidia bacterium]
MKNKIYYLFIIVAILSILLNVFCNVDTKHQNEESKYLNHNDSVKYVGMQQCRACHAAIYNSFIETGMGKSFDLATPQKSSADFTKHHVVFDKFKNLYYHPYWENNVMYILEYRLQGNDTIYKRTEKVDYIIGSGQHTNSHLMNVNGYIYQLPLTWYAQLQKWDLPPGFENGNNSRFSRTIEFECMSCHNAFPSVTDFTANKFVNIPNGIDCERCHGPGEAHLKDKLAGNLVDTAHEIDYTIVNPKKLSWERQIDVCQRCHLQGNSILKEGKTFKDFKPGMVLSDFWEVYMPKYKGQNDEFIMASHAQRLQLSKCFIESNKQNKTAGKNFETMNLTCITCHNPHVSVKKTGTQIFNNACIKCHSSSSQTICTETEKNRMVKQNDCASCHMPRSGTLDIPHVSVHDHWIKKPTKQKEIDKIKEFAGLYCINNSTTTDLSKTKALINYVEKFNGDKTALTQANDLIKNQTETDWLAAQIQLYFLQNDFESIANKASFLNVNEQTNAWLCYRVGQAFLSKSDFVRAELFFEKAVSLSPQSIDFIDKLAQAKIMLNKLSEAIILLNNNLKTNNKQEGSYVNLGFAYLKQNNIALAKNNYNEALALNPDNEQALLNLAAVYNIENNKTEALKLLKRILVINPQNEEVKQLIEKLR